MIESLEQEVIKWAKEKGIFTNSNPLKQFSKTLEEVQELGDALEEQLFLDKLHAKGMEYHSFEAQFNNQNEIEDAIGDIIVTLIIQAKMQNVSLGACLHSAYNVIKKRQGKMVDGVFVKQEDLLKDAYEL